MSPVAIGRHEDHVAPAELAAYVVDALDAERKSAIERHVLACDACSEGLAREARIEAALEAVARRANEASETRSAIVVSLGEARGIDASKRRAAHARRHAWTGGVAGALAAAAAIVLALASTTKTEPAGARSLWDDASEGAVFGAMSGTLAESGFVEGSPDRLDGG